MTVLRDYQQRAKAAVTQELSSTDSTLVVMPTGTGKTTLFCDVAWDWPQGDVIVLAHREELIWQPWNRWYEMFGEYGEVEMAEYRRMHYTNRSKVTFASKDTLYRKDRLKSAFPDPQAVGLIIIDEAHHAVRQNKTYQNILDYFSVNPDIRLLGLTATPDRADEAALGQNFKTVAFDYPLWDPSGGPSAINDGWLVPIHQEFVVCEQLDFSKIGSSGGDFVARDLDREFSRESLLHQITTPTMEVAGDRKTMIFAAGVKQASRTAEILNRYRDNSAYCLVSRVDMDDNHDAVVNSRDKKERQRLLRRYADDKFQYMVNVGCLTEGYDEAGIQCLAMGRISKSRSLYAQMVGRGTRPLRGVVDGLDTPKERRDAIAASAKPHLHVLDFVGNSKHNLMSTADILGGNYSDEAVVAKAKEKAESSGEEVDMTEILKQAEDEVRLELAERKSLGARARYDRRVVSAFESVGVVPTREPGYHQGRLATRRQREALERFKVEPHVVERLSFWDASCMLDKLVTRVDSGLSTYKQGKLLGRYGVDTGKLTFDRAQELIGRLIKNNWKGLW